ncbi:MAG: Na+/H+ antiporter NhaC family protein [Peptostreptococcaceae bacterium]|nr:Na+/H+ antiporter NhaC family protein [Peptostreptococcaceae bacterium]
MDLLIAFIIFAVTMTGCLVVGWSMAIALFIGLVCFILTGLHRGFQLKKLLSMVYVGGKTSFVVLEILILIGFLTALWRASGTISFFVYYGISIITPHMFIVIVFLITMILSFALGTSFGIAGTAGVMLMVLARSGGVNQIVTAGAIMSGAYFGDRCSPASSSASLVAAVSGTNLYTNVKMMLKTGFIPTMITLVIYVILSFQNPIQVVDQNILSDLNRSFDLSWTVIIPAVAMLVLPFFKVKVRYAMIVSIFSAFVLTLFVQKMSFTETIKTCIFGYTAESGALGRILSGGGVMSMVEVVIIVLISCTYSGVFDGTGMLIQVQDRLGSIVGKIGLFPAQVVVSFLSNGVFCNQTVATILNAQILGNVYEAKGTSREELAIDMENSVITIAGIVPWSIACTVPLGILGVGPEAIPYGVLLYMIPLCYLFTKKIWYKKV